MNKQKKIIYSRGFPYGAPMIYIRGGGTRDPEVKALLKENSFVWTSHIHAWQGVNLQPEVPNMLLKIREMGYQVSQKENDKYDPVISDEE